ncbi:bifunctional (p)ppGpp synthetase/guanosine-3',5'-bis(diphosphate) 3'-pyrophosphohydrolase [Nonomuraea sp. NN258]|uniref:HD domain-containing protein n=1 Tax=Nonomuraea antri TaxID=2730852 RepID=UPI0015690EAA|nr:HD domain-containing protein [Nonomuraea antri]NRQ32664.1 bifunctional (p)ppGpp synthetase/guanosine-3',5'-bis(diphosphate) 3'-pyrophosphohydrolase [Nonomuraea antri]
MEIFTSWKSWREAEGPLEKALPQQTVDTLRGAVEFAVRRHGVQQRPTGAPYREHLLEALEVAVTGAGLDDGDVLTAIVLHDVVEDTPCTEADVAARFGPVVAGLVRWVTKPKGGTKEAYLRALATAPSRAVLVKLADRVSNVQELQRMPYAFQRRYYRETVEHILPLADPYPWFAQWYADWRRHWRRLERWPD